MNTRDMEDRVEQVLLYVEIAIAAVSAILLVALLVFFTLLYLKPNMVVAEGVSDIKPPVVCGQVGPMTVYC